LGDHEDEDVRGDLQLNVGFEPLWSLVFFIFQTSIFGGDEGFRAKKVCRHLTRDKTQNPQMRVQCYIPRAEKFPLKEDGMLSCWNEENLALAWKEK
jgi:hypothetical protein